VLQVVESALFIAEPALIEDYLHWLYATGPAHGFTAAHIDAALATLADKMNTELQRAGTALRAALHSVHKN
jgi:hypothetical protein